MSFSASTNLAIAQLVIYILLFPLVFYLLIKHGKHGLLAYVYLVLFDMLRIVPAAMQVSTGINHKPESTTAAILDSVGLSPILLASGGVIHELQHYVSQATGSRSSLEKPLQTLIHMTTVVGVAISAYGASKLADTSLTVDELAHYRHFQEAGSVMLLLAWVLLVVAAAALTNSIRSIADRALLRQLIAVFVALAAILVRAIYGVAYAFDHSTAINPVTGSFAIRLILVFLTLLVASLSLMAGGFFTRQMAEEWASGQYRDQESCHSDSGNTEATAMMKYTQQGH